MEKLHAWHSLYFFARYTPDEFNARKDYYERCARLLNDTTFPTEEARAVWALHSDGISIKNIADQLGIKQYQAHRIIRFYGDQVLGRGTYEKK